MHHYILLVEDDPAISDMVGNHLTKEGFRVAHACDGKEALRAFARESFDLILLDLMLPKLNGMDFLKAVREKSTVPVLIVSAKDGDVEKALGLGFGADDYVTKPFSLIELTARVKAAIRRATQYTGSPKDGDKDVQHQVIHIRDIALDIENMRVKKNGEEIKLTAKEWQILKLFFTNPERVFTKEQIYRAVWQDDYYGDENIINVHMSRLREKIEDDPSSPKYIKTLWGIGYRLGEFEQ
ncbi:response regulator transcription factor [Numidum massiliense]|uniref:response regulator transcription factor n=1 Tax=Numidum massiliense TaxID=1522315 RepID=UPI0006D58ED0|nr:response regulator transcription factor [Numidum massiliense]